VSDTSLAVTARDVVEPQVLKRVKLNEEALRFPEDANDEDFIQSSRGSPERQQ
jgi:hypothetical protein